MVWVRPQCLPRPCSLKSEYRISFAGTRAKATRFSPLNIQMITSGMLFWGWWSQTTFQLHFHWVSFSYKFHWHLLELHSIIFLLLVSAWVVFFVPTSSASCLILSNQSSMSPIVALTSVASSLMRMAICVILLIAASRRFFIWRSRAVTFGWPSSTGSWKLSNQCDWK